MSFYVYGDVHLHIDAVQSFLAHKRPDKVIWLGDWFDSHKTQDEAFETRQTAIQLKAIMTSRPQDVFIMGNHELAYRFNKHDKYKMCGWTPEKQKACEDVFSEEFWNRFVLYHKERWNRKNIYFSHAGLSKEFFPFEVFDEPHLGRIAKIAIDNGNKETYNPLFDNWAVGPMWMRWQNFALLDGVWQVCGHTTYNCPQIRAVEGRPEWNLCMDTAHTYYAHFKDKNAYAINRHQGYEHLLKFDA